MEDNRIIQEAIRIRGNIYDIIQATSLKIHKKDIRKAELWDKIGKQIAKIKIDK